MLHRSERDCITWLCRTTAAFSAVLRRLGLLRLGCGNELITRAHGGTALGVLPNRSTVRKDPMEACRLVTWSRRHDRLWPCTRSQELPARQKTVDPGQDG